MKVLRPLKAIRQKCLDCMCNQRKEVELCPDEECPLYPYRLGKNPNRAGIGGRKGSISQQKATQVRV
jgi:hypothetical protein